MTTDLDIGKGLFSRKDQLLLACSGGPDSVCLFHLLLEQGYSFAVAHVNYQMRSAESDADEYFVNQLCQENEIQCFTRKVEIQSDNQKSIQAEARKIRYSFFDELIDKHGFSYLLTAHHQGDLVENALFRFMRGTGLRGLQSFSQTKGNMIRPLLNWRKEEILDDLKKKGHSYRTDDSNTSLKYSRNKIRNVVLPTMEEDLPYIEKRISRTTTLLKEDYALIQSFIQSYITERQAGQFSHDCDEALFGKPAFWFHLFENISTEECHQVSKACESKKNGFGIEVDGYSISIIQNRVAIAPLKETKERVYTIESAQDGQIDLGNNTLLKIHHLFANKDMLKSDIQYITSESISFPLTIRHPKNGDRFQPLGMQGTKLLSDFYNDLGIPANAKSKEWVLTDKNGEIVAVLPHRIAEPYRITDDLQTMLGLEWCLTES